MRDLKQFLWWLLMPLWVVYFPLGLTAAFVSLLLYIMGFRDLPELIGAVITVPYDYWMKLYQDDL